ncbi:MAG: hypothetical protein M1815_002007 [Lichina confinis]|nr:MAG: hypothetical protein M1815_002007 [Lichina confinis]
MTVFRIDIVSDTTCPWCLIGSRKLSAAIAQYGARHAADRPDDTFDVSWHAYDLQNGAGPGTGTNTMTGTGTGTRAAAAAAAIKSVDKREYYAAKYGAARLRQMEQMMRAAGDEVGVAFRFGGRTGSSRDAHRLIKLAKRLGRGEGRGEGSGEGDDAGDDAGTGSKGGEGNDVNGAAAAAAAVVVEKKEQKKEQKQNKTLETAVVDALFSAYFEQELDITDHDVLTRVGIEAGLDEDAVRDWLKGEGGADEVDRDIQDAVARGISAVPHFTVQGRYHLSGAVDSERFVKVFEEVWDAGE